MFTVNVSSVQEHYFSYLKNKNIGKKRLIKPNLENNMKKKNWCNSLSLFKISDFLLDKQTNSWQLFIGIRGHLIALNELYKKCNLSSCLSQGYLSIISFLHQKDTRPFYAWQNCVLYFILFWCLSFIVWVASKMSFIFV